MGGNYYSGDDDDQDKTLKGATDGTLIGNVGDRLKTESTISGTVVVSPLSGLGADFAFADITTASLSRVVVQRTTYTEQSSNAQRSFASSSANDASAGTGARTIVLTYFTSTGTGPFTETITLNGTSYVNTVATNICYVEHITVATVGSTGSNVGIITMKAAAAGGGATIWTVSATSNAAYGSHHYVSLNKTCTVSGISCAHNGTTVGSGALFTLNFQPILIANSAEIQVSDFVRLYGQSSTFSRVYFSPIKVLGFGRLRLYCTPETTSSTTYRGSYDFSENDT
jgi:hypothetical protein